MVFGLQLVYPSFWPFVPCYCPFGTPVGRSLTPVISGWHISNMHHPIYSFPPVLWFYNHCFGSQLLHCKTSQLHRMHLETNSFFGNAPLCPPSAPNPFQETCFRPQAKLSAILPDYVDWPTPLSFIRARIGFGANTLQVPWQSYIPKEFPAISGDIDKK